MNYGFRKVLVPCSPPSISFSFFKISARARPEARSYKFSFHFRCKVTAFPPHSI